MQKRRLVLVDNESCAGCGRRVIGRVNPPTMLGRMLSGSCPNCYTAEDKRLIELWEIRLWEGAA